MMQISHKRIAICTLVILVCLAITISPALVFAQGLPVGDAANQALNAAQAASGAVSTETDIENKVKEWGLDTVAYGLAGALTTKLTNSVVNWANGGFNGAPQFVNDFGQFFKQQGEGVLSGSLQSLQSISNNNPFARDIARNLITSVQTGQNPNLTQGLQFDLNKVAGPNWQQFYTNASPSTGGWSAWNAIGKDKNNPIGSFLYASNTIQTKTEQLNADTQLEIGSGSGFLGIKKCKKWSKIADPATVSTDAEGNTIYTGQVELTHDDPTNCENWETKTPGSVIKSSLDDALGVPQDRLTAADEFKEVLSASLTTLITGLTNAGLKKLVSSFTQQPTGSIGGPGSFNNLNSGGTYNWLNLPGQVVDIDEQQQILLPDGSYAVNIPCTAAINSATTICI